MEKIMCLKCKEYKDKDQFYVVSKHNKPYIYPYCKLCNSIDRTNRAHKFKIKCVEYKGGKCSICGYSKYYGALEFHHLDKSAKDFDIAHRGIMKFNKVLTDELDKCILVCSNCHRELHAPLV